MSGTRLDRRQFLGGTILAGLALATGRGVMGAVGANDAITLGIIGSGSRGRALMESFLRDSSVRFAAVCDVYEPNRAKGLEIAGDKAAGCLDHRALLEQLALALAAGAGGVELAVAALLIGLRGLRHVLERLNHRGVGLDLGDQRLLGAGREGGAGHGQQHRGGQSCPQETAPVHRNSRVVLHVESPQVWLAAAGRPRCPGWLERAEA